MLSAFPPLSNTDPDEALRRYFEAIEDFHAYDLEAAVTMFIKGAMPGFDGRYAPTPPMLATACRKAAELRQREAYLKTFTAPRLAPPDIEKTDEQRARARAKMQQAIDNLSSATALDSAEALDASKARWKKVNTRFAPDMSEEAVMDRLVRKERGWTVGNDYGDAA